MNACGRLPQREESMGRVKRTEVYYIYKYENSIMKPTKNFEKWGEQRVKYSGGDELVQCKLYVCMELSQDPFYIINV
jgi:hypothetical protein